MKCRILDSVTENSFPSDKTWIILYFICQEGSGRGEGSMGGVEATKYLKRGLENGSKEIGK